MIYGLFALELIRVTWGVIRVMWVFRPGADMGLAIFIVIGLSRYVVLIRACITHVKRMYYDKVCSKLNHVAI